MRKFFLTDAIPELDISSSERDYLRHQAEGKRFAPAEDPAQAMTGTGIMASQAAGLCTIRYIPIGNLMIFPSAYALPGRKVSAFRRAVLL